MGRLVLTCWWHEARQHGARGWAVLESAVRAVRDEETGMILGMKLMLMLLSGEGFYGVVIPWCCEEEWLGSRFRS